MDIKKIEKEICQEIKKAEKDLRAKYDILKHQDLLGALIFLGSLAAIALMWSVYFNNRGNVIVTVAAVLSITFLTSLLHELEHDIIHNLYFRQSIIQDVMVTLHRDLQYIYTI